MTCIDPNCDGSPIKRPGHSTLMYDVPLSLRLTQTVKTLYAGR